MNVIGLSQLRFTVGYFGSKVRLKTPEGLSSRVWIVFGSMDGLDLLWVALGQLGANLNYLRSLWVEWVTLGRLEVTLGRLGSPWVDLRSRWVNRGQPGSSLDQSGSLEVNRGYTREWFV